jgi:uncharacterized protein (DUF362 family)
MFSGKIIRRAFLKRTVFAFTGIFLGWTLYPARRLFARRKLNSGDRSLTVIKGKNIERATIEKMVTRGLENLGGIKRFIKPGMKVVIKPNIGWNSAPERAHNTNPDLVEAVARICVKAGARVKIFDRSVHTPRLCYRRSGILAAAKKAGATIEYMDKRKYRKIPVKNGLAQSSLEVYGDILDADFVINIPIAKDHSASALTLAMKNLMGVLGGRRGWFHLSIHKSIVDFNKAIPQHLVILDALRILTDHGPSSGTDADVKELRTIVMGTNPVTVDGYSAGFFNISPRRIGYLRMAAQEGMGEIERKRMKIKHILV